MDSLPLPPPALIERVGDIADAEGQYLDLGEFQRALIERYLPQGWEWDGRTLLDWGSGAGRLARHFTSETPGMRVVAADIDAPSIAWINANLPGIEGLVVGLEPGIALPDASVDVVVGLSVLTHITDHWAGWLLELRRVLKPGGLAILSFSGAKNIDQIFDGEWSDDQIGMLMLRYPNAWRLGGPNVAHSHWWIRAHWGRAFTILQIDEGAAVAGHYAQDVVLMVRPDTPPPTAAEMIAPDPDEPREVVALQFALDQAHRELYELQEIVYLREADVVELGNEVEKIKETLSWRITRPLREVHARQGRRRA